MQRVRRLLQVPRLADVENGRLNNLNLIRFLLASSVILSHSYVLLDLRAQEPVVLLLKLYDLGGLAVMGFFFLSGLLIFKSALRTSTPTRYLRARLLRIFPALTAAVLACTLVLGPLATTLSLHDYFVSPGLRAFLTELWLRHTQLPLPGVFASPRLFHFVDGPLWTLPAEWLMYIVALFVAAPLRWKAWRPALTTRAWLLLAAVLLLTVQMLPLQWNLASVWMKFFALGSLCYVLRRYIPLSVPVAVGALALEIYFLATAAVPTGAHLANHLFNPVLAYFLLTLGFHPAVHFNSFHRLGDYSYGLYVYAWPLQQLLLTRYPRPLLLFALSYPLTLLLAIASWHFIEQPCLALKSRRDEAAPPTSHAAL